MSDYEIASQSVKGTVILLAGNIASNAVLFIAVLIVARLLGPSSYGEYALALVPQAFLILFSGVGVHTAITRDAAFHASSGDEATAKRKTLNLVAFLILIGAILTVIAFALAGYVSAVILKRPDLTPYVQVASLALLGNVLSQAGIAALVGWGKMRTTAATYIVQASVKAIVSPALVLLGLGVLGAVIGQVASVLFAGSFAVVAIYYTKLRTTRSDLVSLRRDVVDGIRYGLPSEIGNYISNFATQNFLLLLVALYASNLVVGYFQAAVNVTVLISLVSTAVSFSLFRAFSTLSGRGSATRGAFKLAVKYSAYLVTPLVFFLIAASRSIITLIYGHAYGPASTLLSLILLANIAISFGLSVFPAYFNGIAKTRFTMLALLSESASVAVLAPVLGHFFGAYGIAISLIVANFTGVAAALALSARYLDSRIDFLASILAVVTAGASSLAAASFGLLQMTLAPLLAAQIVVFFGLYLILAPVCRVIDLDDVERLKESVKGLGFAERPVRRVLAVEASLIRSVWGTGRRVEQS